MPRIEAGGTPIEKPRPHPAKFSDIILVSLDLLVPDGMYLDPFCGVGKVFELVRAKRTIVGIEIEPEWCDQARGRAEAMQHRVDDDVKKPYAVCANSLKWMKEYTYKRFDGIITSPVYGNRMSDHHNASDGSRRRSYKHDLGREPDKKSSATMYFWQPSYRKFHMKAWKRARDVTAPGGQMFLNVSNFIRNGVELDVVDWHIWALEQCGWIVEAEVPIVTQRMRDGENADVRAPHEALIQASRRK